VMASFRTSTFSRGSGVCLRFGKFHCYGRFAPAFATSGET